MTTLKDGQASPSPRPKGSFEFGRNWQRYIENYFDAERVDIAERSLHDLIGEDLAGKVFLDIGAGSGLFSLCAHMAGSASVVSVDVDLDSVDACRTLRRAVGDPDNWEILHGSILDPEFVARLGAADIVYSWGVLHHTGDMYTALRRAATLVKPSGVLCIAIYNRVTRRFLTSERWQKIKCLYNISPLPIRRAMEAAYLAAWVARHVYRLRNPVRAGAEYKRSRGMALRTDVIDWLGGYPYEYASVDEIVSFCRAECNLEEVKVVPTDPRSIGNNEFVFRPIKP
jgi:2-polyprenyl-3-methyl-5-hydroxy-6-metoxy-1,4-benzoquinol methylase